MLQKRSLVTQERHNLDLTKGGGGSKNNIPQTQKYLRSIQKYLGGIAWPESFDYQKGRGQTFPEPIFAYALHPSM